MLVERFHNGFVLTASNFSLLLAGRPVPYYFHGRSPSRHLTILRADMSKKPCDS